MIRRIIYQVRMASQMVAAQMGCNIQEHLRTYPGTARIHIELQERKGLLSSPVVVSHMD